MRIGRHEVPLSNPDKVFFPEAGLTKGDLVAVLPRRRAVRAAAPARRPFHMKRYPNGVEGEFFHQKRVPAKHPDYVDEVFVSFPSGHSTVFAVLDNAAALAWVVNLGCIELHTWHSRVPEIELPDYLLIDLDPTSDGQWAYVREIALVVREVMDELGLASYPKTSGATGLHILAPIRPELPFPEVRRFAKALAEEVERRVGDQSVATTTWRVADRVGVFVDFGQNSRDQTIACAYSVRPTPDARVSAPLAWEEVADVDPAAFTVATMRERIDAVGDPMRGMWRRAVSLRPRFAKLGLSSEEGVDARAGSTRAAGRSSRQVQSFGSLSAASGGASCRGGSGCPAPCRSAPRPRARAAGALPRARRYPSGSARRSASSGSSSTSGSTCAATSARLFAATAHEPT